MKVLVERHPPVYTVVINRPEVRNAVDRETAQALYEAFTAYEADEDCTVAVLTGAGGHFCSGADLGAISRGEANRLDPAGSAPMGPSRLTLSKPTIAAVAGYAVAGGLELAIWCDLRVVEAHAVFGVFCRRWGVPLIDGGTVRLARLIGVGRALDLILTGRAVSADEALAMGLASRVVPSGQALDRAHELALSLAAFPQTCLRHDRLSLYEGLALELDQALANEFQHGLTTIASRETEAGAARFAHGHGRHGGFD